MSVNLAELERLEREATPGPWRKGIVWDGGAFPVGPFTLNEAQANADAAFIAAVRNALPALLARVRELEARKAFLEDEVLRLQEAIAWEKNE